MSVERVFPIHKTRKVVHGFSLSRSPVVLAVQRRALAHERTRPSVRDRASATERPLFSRRKHDARQHAPRRVPLPAGLVRRVPRGVRASRSAPSGDARGVGLTYRVGSPETAPDGGVSACGAYRGAACDAVLMSSVLTESTYAFAVKCLVAVALGAVIGAQREFSPYLGMFLVARAAHRRGARAPRGPAHARPRRARVVPVHGRLLERVRGTGARAGQRNAVRRRDLQLRHGARRRAGGLRSRLPRRGNHLAQQIGASESGDSQRDEVYGLTTAASLWTTAAVGMHCGGVNQKDKYFAGPAFATALVVITLQALVHFELAAHAAAFERTTTRVGARVVVEVDERLESLENLERLEQEFPISDEAKLDIETSSPRQDFASSANQSVFVEVGSVPAACCATSSPRWSGAGRRASRASGGERRDFQSS